MDLLDDKFCNPKALKLFDPILKINGGSSSIKTGAELHGFFMAIACNPEMLQPHEWLPLIWGKTIEEQPNWKSEKDINEFMQLSLPFFNNCVKLLDEGELKPYFEGKNRVNLAEWSKGFMRGFIFLEPFAKKLLENLKNTKKMMAMHEFLNKNQLNEDTPEITEIRNNHMASLFLAIVDRNSLPIQLESDPELADKILEREYKNIPNAILYFREYMINFVFENSLTKNLKNDKSKNKIIPLHADQKPNRNEICHCGSGKKYKKCCGNK